MLVQSRRYKEAKALESEALELEMRLQGPEHPNTIYMMHRLARSRYKLGQHQAAEDMLQEVVALRRRVLGVRHPYTVESIDLLSYWKDERCKGETQVEENRAIRVSTNNFSMPGAWPGQPMYLGFIT